MASQCLVQLKPFWKVYVFRPLASKLFQTMSLEENRKKIDDEYVHYAVKLKSSLALKKNSKILAKLGVEFDDVCGCNFCIRGFIDAAF